MINVFTKHLRQTGETYFQHMKFALRFGVGMIIAGLACTFHAIFPFLLTKTASKKLIKIMHEFIDRMVVMEDQVVRLAINITKKMDANKSSSMDS